MTKWCTHRDVCDDSSEKNQISTGSFAFVAILFVLVVFAFTKREFILNMFDCDYFACILFRSRTFFFVFCLVVASRIHVTARQHCTFYVLHLTCCHCTWIPRTHSLGPSSLFASYFDTTNQQNSSANEAQMEFLFFWRHLQMHRKKTRNKEKLFFMSMRCDEAIIISLTTFYVSVSNLQNWNWLFFCILFSLFASVSCTENQISHSFAVRFLFSFCRKLYWLSSPGKRCERKVRATCKLKSRRWETSRSSLRLTSTRLCRGRLHVYFVSFSPSCARSPHFDLCLSRPVALHIRTFWSNRVFKTGFQFKHTTKRAHELGCWSRIFLWFPSSFRFVVFRFICWLRFITTFGLRVWWRSIALYDDIIFMCANISRSQIHSRWLGYRVAAMRAP